MKISLEHVSKRFQQHWIFKDINYTFSGPGAYALLGANGSGKSTLLRLVAGIQNTSRGKLLYEYNGSVLQQKELFRYLSFSAPGMELVEELTLKEFFNFHFAFKKPLPGLTTGSIISLIGLEAAAGKPIADYSSGMKQRVKLAQAIFSDTPLLLLDEPCTNLDQAGVEQYAAWMEQYSKNRLVIVASNDVREYYFCPQHITIEDYK